MDKHNVASKEGKVAYEKTSFHQEFFGKILLIGLLNSMAVVF